MEIFEILASEFGITSHHSKNIIELIDEGNTIPFISRYRKEMTGSADDQMLRDFYDRLNYLRNITKRKQEVEKSIKEQEKWTPVLEKALLEARTLTEVEDIYRPYKPKRKTRASVAIAKGLEPLAKIILEQRETNLEEKAKEFVSAEKEVEDTSQAIQGALDIIAEMISDNAELRKTLRQLLNDKAIIEVKYDPTKDEKKTYEMYKDFSQEVAKLPSHRVLAINRGEKEKVLKVSLAISEKITLPVIEKEYLKKASTTEELLKPTIIDAFDRLLFPSLEREIRTALTDMANEQAIKMFEVNLKPLLLQAPLKDHVILGLDPAYRTGCKIAVIDKNGDVLDTTVVYPTPPQNKVEEALMKLKAMIEKHKVTTIAVGNGTASKEAEIFVNQLIKTISHKVSYAMVNEAGASVYSASKLGAQEFPDFDVALRSAASIARRLADPLAELIKIDVKSIGVGQYQHDMPQARLTEVLTGTVEDCVNSVGVDLNTASESLLTYVSGLNKAIASNIVEYRKQIKKFESRKQLLEVPKLGSKAFEQAAGFLRVVGGENVLDNTAVHPEAYTATKKLLKLFSFTEKDIKENNLSLLPAMVEKHGSNKVAEELGVGEPTLQDILTELLKPGRDIRDSMPQPILRSDILSMEDLKPEMILPGTVRNVIDFGVFVDIGVHQDGLVHISEIAKAYIKHPSEVLKVGDQVDVMVLSVEPEKKRIALSIKRVEK